MYVNVNIDVSDVLDELSDAELLNELKRRNIKKNNGTGFSADYFIPKEVARYTLEEAANIFRSGGRYDLAFKLDEINHDFVIN